MVTQTANGLYIHAAWANDLLGTGMKTSPYDEAVAIGTYIDRDEKENTSPSRYTWNAIEDVDEDLVNDDVAEDLEEEIDSLRATTGSINGALKDTQRASNSGIGQANLLLGTNQGTVNWSGDGVTISDGTDELYGETANPTIFTRFTGTGKAFLPCVTLSELLSPIKGEDDDGGDIGTFTFTADVRTSEAVNVSVSVAEQDGTGAQIVFSAIELTEAGEWTHVRSTAQGVGVDRKTQVLVIDLSSASGTNVFDIANLKVEAGESGTDWTIGLDNMASGQSNVSNIGNGETLQTVTEPYFTLGKRGEGRIGAYSLAVGDDAVAGGEHSVAIGKGAEALYSYSVALGENVTTHRESVAIGVDSDAASRDVVIGRGLKTQIGSGLIEFIQCVVGQYNEIEISGRFRRTVFAVGAGQSDDKRRTVFKVDNAGNVYTTGRVNDQQAGRILLNSTGETKNINGTTYTKLSGRVSFASWFDEPPMVILTPISGAPYRLTPPTADNITRDGFDIVMYRNNDTATTVQWIAVKATQS